jgi:hypothetical protein
VNLSSFPWIASTDTLRTEDLLPKFWSVAEQAAQCLEIPFRLPDELEADLEALVGDAYPDAAWDDAVASEALSWLVDVINEEFCPPGFVFGASEGDGACFGFWLSDTWQAAMEHMGLADCDPVGWAQLIADLDADGIDPEAIEDQYEGRAEGLTAQQAGCDFAQALAENTDAVNFSALSWPLTCIDWGQAWRELELGDGYRMHGLGGGEWLVFRN